MIQSAFHRTGDHSRVESCPSPRFASARRSGFPLLRASTRTPPFVRLLPLRYDREHDPIRKVGSSLTPAGRAGARSRPTTMNRRGPRVTFTTQENDGQVCRRSGSRRPYCYGRAGERAVRVTTFPILADGFHRRHGSRAPSGGTSSLRKGGGEPLLDTFSSISWSPIACEGVWRALPRDEPAEDTTDVSRPAKDTNVRTHRDAFGRPSLVRAREDCSSACSSGTREAFLFFTEEGCYIGFSTPL